MGLTPQSSSSHQLLKSIVDQCHVLHTGTAYRGRNVSGLYYFPIYNKFHRGTIKILKISINLYHTCTTFLFKSSFLDLKFHCFINISVKKSLEFTNSPSVHPILSFFISGCSPPYNSPSPSSHSPRQMQTSTSGRGGCRCAARCTMAAFKTARKC